MRLLLSPTSPAAEPPFFLLLAATIMFSSSSATAPAAIEMLRLHQLLSPPPSHFPFLLRNPNTDNGGQMVEQSLFAIAGEEEGALSDPRHLHYLLEPAAPPIVMAVEDPSADFLENAAYPQEEDLPLPVRVVVEEQHQPQTEQLQPPQMLIAMVEQRGEAAQMEKEVEEEEEEPTAFVIGREEIDAIPSIHAAVVLEDRGERAKGGGGGQVLRTVKVPIKRNQGPSSRPRCPTNLILQRRRIGCRDRVLYKQYGTAPATSPAAPVSSDDTQKESQLNAQVLVLGLHGALPEEVHTQPQHVYHHIIHHHQQNPRVEKKPMEEPTVRTHHIPEEIEKEAKNDVKKIFITEEKDDDSSPSISAPTAELNSTKQQRSHTKTKTITVTTITSGESEEDGGGDPAEQQEEQSGMPQQGVASLQVGSGLGLQHPQRQGSPLSSSSSIKKSSTTYFPDSRSISPGGSSSPAEASSSSKHLQDHHKHPQQHLSGSAGFGGNSGVNAQMVVKPAAAASDQAPSLGGGGQSSAASLQQRGGS